MAIYSSSERQKAINTIAVISLFLCLTFFFTSVCPIIPYDCDDWSHLSKIRSPFPEWGGWNPSKVLPEISMPIIGLIGAYVLNPVIENYMLSLTLATAIFISLLVVVYFSLFFMIGQKKLYLNTADTYFISLINILFHFIIFRYAENKSMHMFSAIDYVTYYHYMVSNLFNAILVMYLFLHDNFLNIKISYCKKGVLLLCIYLAMFSNLYSNIILSSYAAYMLCINLYRGISIEKNTFINYIRCNTIFLVVLAMWCISLIFEYSGGRSGSIGVPIQNLPIKEVLKNFKTVLCNYVNIYFIAISICIVLTGLICIVKDKKNCGINSPSVDSALKQTCAINYKNVFNIFCFCLFCCFINVIYLTLLCGKTYAWYATRSDCIFCITFFCLLIIFIFMSIIITKFDKAKFFIPIILFISITQLFNDKSYMLLQGRSPYKLIEINNYLIDQIKESVSKNQKEMVLLVPNWNCLNNWPHGDWIDMARTLKLHGIIDKYVRIRTKPDVEVNKILNLPYKH